MPGMEEEDLMREPHLTLEQIQSLKGKQIMDRQKEAERLACTSFGDIADEFFAMRDHIDEITASHQKANAKVEDLIDKLEASRETGCFCDEYGNPCAYCELLRQFAALEAENQRLREALEDVLRWAGKDKRRCKYTVTEMLESLNRAAAALAQPTKEEEQG